MYYLDCGSSATGYDFFAPCDRKTNPATLGRAPINVASLLDTPVVLFANAPLYLGGWIFRSSEKPFNTLRDALDYPYYDLLLMEEAGGYFWQESKAAYEGFLCHVKRATGEYIGEVDLMHRQVFEFREDIRREEDKVAAVRSEEFKTLLKSPVTLDTEGGDTELSFKSLQEAIDAVRYETIDAYELRCDWGRCCEICKEPWWGSYKMAVRNAPGGCKLGYVDMDSGHFIFDEW